MYSLFLSSREMHGRGIFFCIKYASVSLHIGQIELPVNVFRDF